MHSISGMRSRGSGRLVFALAKSRLFLCSLPGVAARLALRRNSRVLKDPALGLPIFVLQCNQDPFVGSRVVTEAIRAVVEHSPLWAARMRRLFNSLMLVDTVGTTQYFPTDKCCMANPWNIARSSGTTSSASILLAGSMVWSACQAMLLEGRFGSVGLCHQQILGLHSELRFLKNFLVGDNKVHVLAAMSLYSKLGDQIHAGRSNLYETFEKRHLRE